MKTRLLIIIIVGLSVTGIFVGLYVANVIQNIESQKFQEEWRELRASVMNTLGEQKKCKEMGGAWNDDHCLITSETFDSNNLTCDPGPVLESGTCSSNGITLVIQSKTSDDVDDFDKTWGGPGNRHPAFWGFDIPKVCTEDMIKHLVKHSSMFDRDVPYAIEDIGHDLNVYDFDRCVEELLERNPKDLENQDTVISKWDFRQETSYVIIPLGAVVEGNTSLIPEEIRVVLGKNNTVTWINKDDTAHTFLSDEGGDESWSTGMMKPGESSSVTFNKTGVFEYYGTPGPWKTGKVIVVED